MFSRINLLKIIIDHFKTLRDISSESDKMPVSDILLFIVLPLTISFVLIACGINIKVDVANFITAVSILCGFLFNLLAVIYNLMDKIRADVEQSIRDEPLRKMFISSIHSNISYGILESVFVLILLLGYSCISESAKFLNNVLLALIYFLLAQFFLTLLMILNRIYILMKKEN